MSRWSDELVRGALALPVRSGPGFSEISTDTRSIVPGGLFIALTGERFDGHNYLTAAAAAGARAAIVRRGTPPAAGLELLEVDDPLQALGFLARARRRELSGPVVAITGTNGKTSTKEMMAAVLRTRYRVQATAANLNNLIGVPTTILGAAPDTEALVVEAGANVPGEIARYRQIIEPTIAVVTNVGAGHLEGFGSVEGVMREKLALVEGVPLSIVGTEPPTLAARARAMGGAVITAGTDHADVHPDDLSIDELGRPMFIIDHVRVNLPLPGKHLAANAMLAWAVVRQLDLDRSAAAAALSSLSIPGGRSELTQVGDLTILNDCYNANPQSFRAVIATAAAMRRGRRLVMVVGTMRELGPTAAPMHADIARELVALEPDLLAAVGDFVPALEPYAAQLGGRLITAGDPLTLGPLLAERLRGDEIVVLKASRGVALERIVPFLTLRPNPAD